MNYDCPECGRPQLCGRLYQESFFFGEKLVDMEVNQECRGCGTSWKAITRVGKKDNNSYDRMDFVSVNRVETKQTWQEKVQEQCLALKPKKLLT